MINRTIFISRLIGIYCIIAAIAMFIRGVEINDTIALLVQDTALMFLIGIITLFAGIAMVLLHNIWHGGMLTVSVTILSWLTLLKGAGFLLLSEEWNARFFLKTLHYQENFFYFAGIALVIGVALACGGFFAQRKEHTKIQRLDL